MELEKLRNYAIRLREVLAVYAAVDDEAKGLQVSLTPSIERAIEGLIAEPLEFDEVPTTIAFIDGGLAKYNDLHEAYADFLLEVTDMADDEDDE